DRRRVDAVLRKAERDRATGDDLGRELVLGNALEQALVVRAPRAEDPVVRSDVLEDVDHLLLVAGVQMNRGADRSGVEERGDAVLEGDKLRGGRQRRAAARRRRRGPGR